MAESAVVNASPLIFLARGACVDLLQVASTQILVPMSVDQELRRRGQNDPAVQAMDQSPWLLTVGIVLAAKQRGLIPLARPLVERMRQSGMYLSDRVMNSALAIVGE